MALFTGLAFGSFANVVVHRVPRSESIVVPGSACPSCGTPLAWYDNIPLLSFLVLKGRCRHCHATISVRYPLIEGLVGVLWALTALVVGLRPELPAFLAFVTVLVMLGAIDLEHRRLPNRILGPASIVAGVLLLAAAPFSGWTPLLMALAGAAAYGGPMLLLGLAFPAGMGGGDIKLAGYIGLHLGWLGLLHVLVGAMAGFIVGGVVGVALLVAGRKGRKDPVPFGPAMAVGALVALFAGEVILRFWLPI